MVELSKEAARYYAGLEHKRSGDLIDFVAVVIENPDGRFHIRYSHTFRPSEDAGFYYSDSFTSADTLEAAKSEAERWADMLSKSYEVATWHEI